MQLKFVLMAVWVCICSVASAQADNSAKPAKRPCSCSFSSINQLGLLRGEPGSYFQFQTINGIRYKTWFAGVGAGLDLYPIDGIPVFMDVRKYIFDKVYTPFVYADAGIHFADRNNESSEWQRIEYSNGFYYDAGLGYKIGLNKKSGILLSGGYSYKFVEKRVISTPDCRFYPCIEVLNRFNYRFNRLSLKLGWQF